MDPLQAFRLIDSRREQGLRRDQLMTLRRRLAGELLGDHRLVDETLAADFELVTHTEGKTAVLNRAALLTSVRRLGSGSALMWVELADLAVDNDVIAGQGLLRTLAGTS